MGINVVEEEEKGPNAGDKWPEGLFVQGFG